MATGWRGAHKENGAVGLIRGKQLRSMIWESLRNLYMDKLICSESDLGLLGQPS